MVFGPYRGIAPGDVVSQAGLTARARAYGHAVCAKAPGAWARCGSACVESLGWAGHRCGCRVRCVVRDAACRWNVEPALAGRVSGTAPWGCGYVPACGCRFGDRVAVDDSGRSCNWI